jgi:hypothetical protein
MNPRRVHELMTANFPKVDLAKRSWVNLLESDGTLRRNVLAALLDEFINADELLVEVSRKLGDLLPKPDVIPYLARHIGCGEVRISDRAFQRYVVVGANGVATGWSTSQS